MKVRLGRMRRRALEMRTASRINTIKLAGLVWFVAVALHAPTTQARIIAVAVLANGVVCHANAHNPRCARWDIACNVAFVAAVNGTTTWQPYSALASALGGAAFAASRALAPGPAADWVHVLAVQSLAAQCIYHWA